MKEDKIVESILDRLKVGQVLKVRDIARKDPKKFVEITKQLIDNGRIEFEFSEDYREIKRTEHDKKFFDDFRKQTESKKNVADN